MSFNEVVAGKNAEELDALIKAAEEAREAAKVQEAEEFDQLVQNVKTKAKQLGINVKDLFVEKKEFAPKYVNPANTEQKWNGRGPIPAWMKTLLVDVPKEGWKEAKKAYLIQ